MFGGMVNVYEKFVDFFAGAVEVKRLEVFLGLFAVFRFNSFLEREEVWGDTHCEHSSEKKQK